VQRLTMAWPDDWHLHLRDGALLAHVVRDSARRFRRAVVMPNLDPPVTTAAQARAYRERILAALPPGTAFEPLMTLYLTERTTPAEIRRAAHQALVHGIKLYPAGATTGSQAGVRDLARLYPVLEVMQEVDMPLLVHGEVVDAQVDIFDRERIFVERELAPLAARFPGLRIVLEHVTTAEGIDFVRGARAGVGATITAHHLLLNRNALLAGGLRPHHYCLPVLKREEHRRALVTAATAADPRFFLGTDSAPHPRARKESACGCAGIYTAHAALELYAEVFAAAGCLERLEAFASFHGADFYRLPRNRGQITLERREWSVPRELPIGDDALVPLRAGERVQWRLAD
jgi:dihydroorotase